MVASPGNRFLCPGPQDWVTHSCEHSHKDARQPPHCSCLCCRTARESRPKLAVRCCIPASGLTLRETASRRKQFLLGASPPLLAIWVFGHEFIFNLLMDRLIQN